MALTPLDQINGQQFVAQTPQNVTNPTHSPANVVQGLNQQLAAPAQPAAADAVAALNNQFKYTPNGTGISTVQNINQAFQQPALDSVYNTVTNPLNQLLDSSNPYIQNAKQRAAEQANSRGMMNSSVAAGAGQRAAIESSMPIFGQMMGLNQQREQNAFAANQASRAQALSLEGMDRQAAIEQAQAAFQAASQLTGQDRQNAFAAAQNRLNQAMDLTQRREQQSFLAQQAGLDRVQGVNNAMLASQLAVRNMTAQSELSKQEASHGAKLRETAAANDATRQNWLNNNEWKNKTNYELSSTAINSASQMSQFMLAAMANDPEVFTPANATGLMQFIGTNMPYLLSSMLKNLNVTTTGGGT